MVIKILQYSIENDFHGDIKPVIVFDKESYYRKNRPVNYSYDSKQHLWFNPVIIILESVKLEELEEHGDIHLVPLYPLCGISAAAIEEQAPRWVERIKKESASDLDRENILALLGGFIAHRLGAIGLEKLNSLLGDFKMEETQVGKDLINIGHISGWKEGLGEGLEKGIAKGMAKGRREEAIQVLVLLLEQRFGKVPVELVEKIQRIKKIEKIHQLIKDLKDLTELSQLNNILNLSSGPNADAV